MGPDAAPAAVSAPTGAAAPTAVATAGALRGVLDHGVPAFLGVPYAAPPLGDRRWRGPQPLEPWEGTRDAAARAPAPPQPARPPSLRFFGDLSGQDEDCLRLDLWTPAVDGPPRPVLVWVHGGGFTIGSAGSAVFDGAALCRALDAVVVVVGYRLGSLGWLHHPALAAGEGAPAGNWGLQDVIAALGWVQADVGAFGGDPARVTVAGESAGAATVVHLLGAPGARGRFARALAMSPPLGESTHPAALGTRWALALAAELGVAAALGDGSSSGPGAAPGNGSAREALAALRDVPAQGVVAAHERLLAQPAFRGTRGGALPVVDPATIPADPLEVPGSSPEVPLLVGTNADEATFFFRQPGRVLEPDHETLRRMVAHQPGVADADAALRRFGAALGTDDANELLVRIATEAIFTGPVGAYTAARVAAGARVHRYRLEHPSPQPGFGAVHSVGVPLLFGSHRTPIGAWLTGDDARAREVSGALQRAVAGWVHDADPGWAPVDRDAPGALAVFGGEGAAVRPGHASGTLLD